MLKVTQFVNDIFSSNMYLLTDNNYPYCWLVDIGDYYKIASFLPEGIDIKGLLLTHTHFDHIYGINELHKAQPSCIIYTSAYGRDALFDDRKNLSRYHDAPVVYEGDVVKVLDDGDEIELFPGQLATVYSTPGHCPSELTISVNNYVFTGDAYIPGLKVITHLPGGDRELAVQSEKRIKELARNKLIYSGHGDGYSSI